MISQVASAIGEDMCRRVAFVGGCTTGLLLTDNFTLEQVRHTDDVDLIVHVVGPMGWADLQAQLRQRGFKDQMAEDGPICAMWLGELRVDFMPDDQDILGFSNRWYQAALETAEDYQIDDGVIIRLVKPEYFVATKLEAYLGRGNNDPLESQDVEDILNLFDGRSSLIQEIRAADKELRCYVSEQLSTLKGHRDFDYVVQSTAMNDSQREEWIVERVNAVISMGAV